jgi:hypothetical protein
LCRSFIVSGLLTPIGKTSPQAMISKEPTKFVVKISLDSRYNKFYQKKWNDNPEKGIIDVLCNSKRPEIKKIQGDSPRFSFTGAISDVSVPSDFTTHQ